ncbi:Uma2 family endonuclease [Sorangium sp. So ce1036]|uniref:Uma2 family endonuclease n=1 Tax=Sorangium sp. So ce1036 TaxID=3133328 RepID=UPI003F01D25F
MATGFASGAGEPARLTLEAWADLDEDEAGELVDGRVEEEEIPSVLHAAVVAWLMRVLGVWASLRGGRVFGSELKLGMRAQERGRKPDVSMYLPGARLPARGSPMAKANRPPGVVIEVTSPRPRDARRDRIEKLGEYARFGVRFTWILDPQVRGLEIFELGRDGRYAVALSASEGVHEAPGCEGLSLDLDALWRELDELPEEEDEGQAGTAER